MTGEAVPASPIILDCSMAISFCFADEFDDTAQAVLDHIATYGALVPSLWALEIDNVLIVAERRGRIAEADVAASMQSLAALPIDTDSETAFRALRETLELARRHGLSSYDAAYLELAIRSGYPIASRDMKLLEAARTAGCAITEF